MICCWSEDQQWGHVGQKTNNVGSIVGQKTNNVGSIVGQKTNNGGEPGFIGLYGFADLIKAYITQNLTLGKKAFVGVSKAMEHFMDCDTITIFSSFEQKSNS